MKKIVQISQVEAINFLQEFGSKNQEEKVFSCELVNYHIGHGRKYFYHALLENDDVLKLFFLETPDLSKVVNYTEKIKREGYNSRSYLALRDLNPGEEGSFYVENGKHRVSALKNILRSNFDYHAKIPAIILSRNELSPNV